MPIRNRTYSLAWFESRSIKNDVIPTKAGKAMVVIGKQRQEIQFNLFLIYLLFRVIASPYKFLKWFILNKRHGKIEGLIHNICKK